MSYYITIAALLCIALFMQMCGMYSMKGLNHLYCLFFFVVNINGQECPEAEDSCHGTGGGDLCNDRCKSCGYNRGECGGTLWQVCQCFRSRAELLEARSHDALLRILTQQLDASCPDEPENCSRQCKRDGYNGGRCSGARCKCH